MKVLDLRCAHDHRFEGWFGSTDDYVSQRERGLVSCPVCGDAAIERMPSAPHLNVAHLRAGTGTPAVPASGTARESVAAAAAGSTQPAPAHANAATGAAASPSLPAERQAHWMAAMREVLARTEDVGERFPEEARRIHYGESGARLIRDQATADERAELAEEGIEVHTLAVPESLKGPLQ